MREKVLSLFVCISLCICAILFISGCKKEDKKVFVTFFVDGKTYLTVETNGKSIKEMPKDPKKTGYEFEGWFYDKDTFENEFTQDSLTKDPIKKDTSIYAWFTVIEYTISYTNIEGATNSNVETYNIETPTITLTDLSSTREGYFFAGWFIGENEVTEITIGSYGNKNLEAKWSLTEYKATFKNGTDIVDTRTFNVEDTVIDNLPTVPAKDYYTGVWESYTISANDMTINAVYTPIEYEISYELDEGTNDPSNPAVYNILDGTINLKNPRKDGHTFNGWEVDEVFVSSISNLTEDITLVATWINEVKLTYTKEGNDNIIITGFEDPTIKSTLRLLNIGETYDGYNIVGIDKDTFKNCTRLIYNQEENINYLGNETNPYLVAMNITDNTLSNYTLQNTTKIIYEKCFMNCSNLESIIIPDSVVSIGNSAFYGCTNLESMAIPNSVESMGLDAFTGCTNLAYKTVENINYLGNETNDYLVAVSVKDNTLVSYNLQNTTKLIGGGCFFRCESLVSITIPDSVKSIGESGFFRCESLASITIGNGVESIGKDAFYYCKTLENITIPNCVKSIRPYAFESCINLKSVTIGNSVENIGNSAFLYCEKLESIVIPDSITTISKNTFYGCKKLVDVTIPDGVVSIGTSAFSDCDSLVNITIPNSVKKIESGAFRYCYNLVSIVIPDSVEFIESSVFAECSSLSSITIGSAVESIGQTAFQDCDSLATVYLKSAYVAYGLSTWNTQGQILYNVKTIYIEVSITTIGECVTNNFTKGSTTTVDDVTYNIYNKTSLEN